MDDEKIKLIRTVRIHPAIGIARIGNSPNEYFIGPELPGVWEYPPGGYRGAQNQLKRQAARFRLFGYDERDRLVGEITETDALIEWTVHLKNTKAVGRRFAGVLHPDEPERNSEWTNAGNPANQLVLDGGVKRVSKPASEEPLLCECFMNVRFEPVLELGKLIYEKGTGRLLVLGGHGKSGTPFPHRYPLDKKGSDFANHDGWFDDVSDGPVTAKVNLKGGLEPYVKAAWVIVAPPKYAPEFQNIVTLYDTLYQVAIDRGQIPNPFSDPRFLPSFNRDIYPILRRAEQMRWVFAKSNIGHTFAAEPGEPNERLHLFKQLRAPSHHPHEPGTGTGRMPYMWSDLYLEPRINGTLTPTQYRVLQAWAEGNFENDWAGEPPPLSFHLTPDGLDLAALEACVGAAFYPGIEASWKMRDVFQYVEPFRLDHESLAPGDISQQMSLPWQTDFVDCGYEDPYVWWPAQRPIDVRVTANAGDVYEAWDRVFRPANSPQSIDAKNMVHDFPRLGHVLRSGEEFVETGRVALEPEVKFNQNNFDSPLKPCK